jgi:Mn-dependent DtxR family transcriptional regulator
MADKFKGGRADKAKESDFDPKELQEGIAHEMEHTDDPKVAKEIAMDHLAEDPEYYEHLEEMEEEEEEEEEQEKSMTSGLDELGEYLQKGGPYIGPKGGKWADPEHKIPWDEKSGKKAVKPSKGQLQVMKEVAGQGWINTAKYPKSVGAAARALGKKGLMKKTANGQGWTLTDAGKEYLKGGDKKSGSSKFSPDSLAEQQMQIEWEEYSAEDGPQSEWLILRESKAKRVKEDPKWQAMAKEGLIHTESDLAGHLTAKGKAIAKQSKNYDTSKEGLNAWMNAKVKAAEAKGGAGSGPPEPGPEWTKAAQQLLVGNEGIEQSDLHYRAYLRGIIAGNHAQAQHMRENFAGAKKAAADLIELAPMIAEHEATAAKQKVAEQAPQQEALPMEAPAPKEGGYAFLQGGGSEGHVVDTEFINKVQHKVPGATLSHMGFGDFKLTNQDGKSITFSRTGNPQREGFSGREHEMRGDPELIQQALQVMGHSVKKSMTQGLDAMIDFLEKADDGKPGESLGETDTKELKATHADLMARLKDKPDDKAMQARHQAIVGELKKRGEDVMKKAMPSESADVSPEKARKILHDGEVHGKPLTEQQRKFFGAIGGHLPAPGKKVKKAMTEGLDQMNEYLEKAGLPGHEPKLGAKKSSAQGGSADGGEVADVGMTSGSNNSSPASGTNQDGAPAGAPKAKKDKFSEDDAVEEKQMKPHKKPIETYKSMSPANQREEVAYENAQAAARLRKGEEDIQIEPHPYSTNVLHGNSDEIASELVKSEDFYHGGSPNPTPHQSMLSKSVLCKSCHSEHAAMLTACPDCGYGAVTHRVMPGMELTVSQSPTLEKSQTQTILRKAKEEPDILIK